MTGSADSTRGSAGRLRAVGGAIRRRWRVIALLVLVVLIVGAVAGVVYLEMPYRGDADRLDEVEASDDVVLEHGDGEYVLRGGDVTDETVGVVFYPGARVHPEAYLWTLAPIVAEEDVVVVVPEMPLNLAILDSSAADDVMASHGEIDRWVVGGHSLGGAMACRYAADTDADLEGVLLFAAYCDDGDDLRGSNLPVLSVQGTADGVIDQGTERANRDLLGSDSRVVELEGMNHAQFGAYGDQRGDDPAEISDEAARDRLTAAVLEWLVGLG